jgi:hypothetical protein
VAWSRVHRPLELGGLGVMDLRLQGMSLQMRWLWLEKTDPTRLWGRLTNQTDALTCSFFLGFNVLDCW